MKSKLTQAYENAKVGDTFWLRADAQDFTALSAFQAVFTAAQLMQKDGLVHIVSSHHENMTGKSFIDAIQVHKMK